MRARAHTHTHYQYRILALRLSLRIVRGEVEGEVEEAEVPGQQRPAVGTKRKVR